MARTPHYSNGKKLTPLEMHRQWTVANDIPQAPRLIASTPASVTAPVAAPTPATPGTATADGYIDASQITSGLVALAVGGTDNDLSGTGGANQIVKQVSAGAPLTVGQLTTGDLAPAVMVASGVGHAGGAVPDPGASSGTTHYLREDASWGVPVGSLTLPTDYVSGAAITWTSATVFTVQTCTVYSTKAGGLLSVASSFAVTPASLANSTWYYVGLDTATTVVLTTAAPTKYFGEAWQDALGRRIIGTFLTNSGGNIINFLKLGGIGGQHFWRASNIAAPYLLANFSSATSSTVAATQSCAGIAPATSNLLLAYELTTGQGTIGYGTSDGFVPASLSGCPLVTAGGSAERHIPLDASQAYDYWAFVATGTMTYRTNALGFMGV